MGVRTTYNFICDACNAQNETNNETELDWTLLEVQVPYTYQKEKSILARTFDLCPNCTNTDYQMLIKEAIATGHVAPDPAATTLKPC